ncbi:MAG: ROK family protein [Chloroflexi bacterium]|nr:ROK family protein [Chloroflexota bacterium]
MSARAVVGIDLGGTKIRAVVVDADGQILGEDVRSTGADDGQAAVVDRLVASAEAAIRASGQHAEDVVGVGVTAPGPVDFERGILHQPPNLPGWEEVPLAEILRSRLGRPTFLENDANAAALGEHVHGAGRGVRHMIYLTISTGIGAGLILNGSLYRGADGAAGELGHIAVDDNGPLHACGMYGCLEVMASGTAIARMALEAARDGRSPALAKLAERGLELTAEEVDRAADAGDDAARAILALASRYLGVGFASMINIFNPERIVVGGGVSRIGSQLLEPAYALAKSRAFRLPASTVQFRQAALEGRAEVLGVAALARESV